MADPQLLQQAQLAIAEFERSNVPGLWPGLNKEQVIAEMRARLNDPFQVNQGGQPFCGPAAILFELARRHPPKYVEICRNLFQIGGFHTQSGQWISPSPRLRESKGNLLMPQADWMVLSTLRESENLIFPVEADAPDVIRNIGGMTKPWEMAGWVREILGYPQANYHFAYRFGALEAMRDAQATLNAGGTAFALITAQGMLGNKLPLIPYPSHWIALLGNFAIQDGTHDQAMGNRISFDIYTWAQKMHVDLAEGLFENCFWGVVLGRA